MSDFIDCNNNNISDEELLSALVTKTAAGNWALRTMEVTACAEDAISCDTTNMTPSEILRRVIGINECGKPAIRLAIGTEA
jgi:hypothetical protein